MLLLIAFTNTATLCAVADSIYCCRRKRFIFQKLNNEFLCRLFNLEPSECVLKCDQMKK